MYSERQKQMLGAITRRLGLAEPESGAVIVKQSPSYIDSVIETADFAVAALGAVGSAVVKKAEEL
jgi:RNA-binding protein YlmH